MEQLQVLSTQKILEKEFTIYGDAENPLFLAKDVAEWIGYDTKNAYRLYDTVDEDERKTCSTYYVGEVREMKFLTEDGLYEVLMQSRKSLAKQFKSEVKTILKTIRQTGGYITSPDLLIKTYFNEIPKPQQVIVKALFEQVTEQQKSIVELKHYNQLLGDKNLEMDNRKILNALVHSLAGLYGFSIPMTWEHIYDQLYRVLHINIKARKRADNQTWLDLLTERELRAAISLATSLAQDAGSNLLSLLNRVNSKKIQSYQTDYDYFANTQQ